MTNYPKIMRTLLGTTALATAALFIPIQAEAAVFAQCVPGTTEFSQDKTSAEEWERKACAAENAVYATWESKLAALGVAQQDLSMATNTGDWKTYREKWAKALPMVKEMQAAAAANRQVPGAAAVVILYGQDIQFLMQNAGLGSATDLDSAAQKIIAGLDGEKASQAGTAGVQLVAQSVTRGVEFIRGLGQSEKAEVQQARSNESKTEASAIRDRQEGRTVTGYVGGFGDRLAVVWKGFLFLLLVVMFGAAWLAGKRRLNPAVVGITAGIAYLLPGVVFAVSFVLLPMLPQWFGIGATLAGTVGMYYFGGRVFEWMAARLGTSPLAKHLRTLGGTLDNLRESVSGRAPTGDAASEMAAEKATHGSARWGTTAEMIAGGHLAQSNNATGFALARAADVPAPLDERFRFTGHVVTVAPTGAGKGIGAVIPNLLTYPGSALVLDVKGENAAVTARARRQMGHKVYVVDPFNETKGETHAFNLLDRINPTDPECVSESAALADSLVIVDTKGGEAHFDESAKMLLQGLMLHVSGLSAELRHLGELRRMLTTDEETFLGTLADMASDESVAFGIPARAANTLMGMADRERGSVLSTARRHTSFLDDPRIAATLSRSDFELANIKNELMTVYLVLPAVKISTNARFVRGFIASVIAAVTSSPKQPAHRVAFFLDEFGQLGYMKAIEDAVSLLRGYGLSFWIFIQDLSQLKGVYPKWQTFLANSAKTFFGTDDYDTAKYISDSLGQATIEYETENEGKNTGSSLSGGGGSMNRGKSAGVSQQFAGRSLLTPDEVMRLGPERPIVLLKGEYPYQLTRLNYLTDSEYQGLADPNPYHS
jgi:type IV secretion system protein VirD4